ncbi:MAG: hypothetical protein V2A58_07085 [Planctomycetota bacterium]
MKRKTRRRVRGFAGVVGVCILWALWAGAGEMGRGIGPEKKLVKWGVDTPNSAYVREHAQEMEEWPFDGIVINADIELDGQRQWLHGQMFSTRRFTHEELAHIVDDFKATKLTRFTDNFLVMSQSIDVFVWKDASGKETRREELYPPDWFNDEEYAITAANWALAARVCKEADLAGFMMDLEMWPTTNGKYPRAWDYAFCKRHNGGDIPPFEACYEKVRERGREIMGAVCKEYPDITIINYMGSQEAAWRRVGVTGEVKKGVHPLETSDYGLLAPFLDGMLEGIPEGLGATIVDGGALYHANLNKRFAGYRAHEFARSVEVTGASEAFEKHMRLGFAVWVDGRGWRTKADWSWPWEQEPPYWGNQFTPEELEYAYYYALLNADKYVWIWAENATFFPQCGFRRPQGVTVNAEYRRAFENCRKPHRMDFKRDDRGALTDPPAPKLAPYNEEEVFGGLKEKYEFVADLPMRWRFRADAENVGTFGAEYGKPEWEYCGETWRDWGTIEIGDYWENRGVKFNGHGWYRTTFDVPKELAGKKIFLCFGGMTLHPVVGAQVYVNGTLLWAQADMEKESPVLVMDITGAAKPGEENVAVVQVFNYGGPGGIYWPVKLATLREGK